MLHGLHAFLQDFFDPWLVVENLDRDPSGVGNVLEGLKNWFKSHLTHAGAKQIGIISMEMG
jgi:hypothetical protein